MNGSPQAQALHLVGAFRGGDGRGAWRLDRSVVADRLAELVQRPFLISQGRLNLCGPALLFKVWLERDPVACVRFAVALFEEGRAWVGSLPVRPSVGLLAHAYGRLAHAYGRRPRRRAANCPPADWMLMAALRDATNRVWPYRWEGGPREAIAAMTLPGSLCRWLSAIGVYRSVRNETNLVLARGVAHARSLAPSLVPSPDRDVFLLVASEMFDGPSSLPARLGKYVVSLLPNHWIELRSRVVLVGEDGVGFTFWSWGADQPPVVVPRVRFRRCYYGAVVAEPASTSAR